MHRLLSTAAGAALLSLAAIGGVQAEESSLGAGDLAFVLRAAAGGMEEVALGELATKQAANTEVKQFGEMMVAEHTAVNKLLSGIAEKKDVDLPNGLDPAAKMVEDDLEEKEGTGFDKEYVAQQAAAHDMTLTLFRHASEHALDPEIKAFAQQNTPKIQQHLEMLQKMMNMPG